MKYGAADLDDALAQPPALARVDEQVFRQQGVQVEEGEGIETNILRLLPRHEVLGAVQLIVLAQTIPLLNIRQQQVQDLVLMN